MSRKCPQKYFWKTFNEKCDFLVLCANCTPKLHNCVGLLRFSTEELQYLKAHILCLDYCWTLENDLSAEFKLCFSKNDILKQNVFFTIGDWDAKCLKT